MTIIIMITIITMIITAMRRMKIVRRMRMGMDNSGNVEERTSVNVRIINESVIQRL
jgi:hypothetical protein